MSKHYLGICHFFGYGVIKNESLGLEILSKNDIDNSENLLAYLINGDYEYTPDETVVPDLPFYIDKFNTQVDNAHNEYLYDFYEGKIIEYDWSGKEIVRTTDINLQILFNESLNEFDYLISFEGNSVGYFAENFLSTVSFNNRSFKINKLFPDDIGNSSISRKMQDGLFSIRTITSSQFPTSFFRNTESSGIVPSEELIVDEYLVATLNYQTPQYSDEPGAPMLMVAKPTGYATRIFKDNVLEESYFVYPNPFSTHLSIGYELETSASVTLEIYNSQGILMNTIIPNQLQSAGINYKMIVTDAYPSGIYFVRLSVNPSNGEEKILSKTIIKH
ncbi:hypothetical protein GCM10022393_00570 [Aquimarina addita]|uniref:Secretion system C-terminal sorting domain-containing protein n=1 Tax=Aquimarina addita TaxID=870485 RepID=A0ABP7X718_9FLAO